MAGIRTPSATRSGLSSNSKGSPMTGSSRRPSGFADRDEGPAPVLVEPPRRSAPVAERVRLRLPDRPGALAALAGHLAHRGVDVLRVEVIDRDLGTAVDDMLLVGERLDEALADLGSRAVVLAR